MPNAFAASQTAKVTSTTSSQTITIPRGQSTLQVYNAAANPVHLAFAATVAVPTGTFGAEIMTVAPGRTANFDINSQNEVVIAFIAETAGGALYISLGENG